MATPLEQWIPQAQAYWRLAVKYKWYTLVSSLALALVFTVIIARFPNVYEATTTILVDPQQIPEKYVSPAVNSDPSSRLNTLTQQVLSSTRLQEIIDKLNLYPEHRRSISPKKLIEEMRHDITIQVKVKQGPVPELSTFTVTYQGKNPMLTAEVANELANSFIQWNINSREQQVAGTKDFLSSKLDAARQKQQAERFTELGARVCILLETDSVRRHARIDLAAEPPTIYLIRRSPVCGEKYLNNHEEHLLTPRERFSVAHELGHLVAYQRFNVFPATEKSTYWAQEEWMHRFAGALLTPDAILDECLLGLGAGEPVCPFTLYSAAADRVRLSQEVLATQLCLRRPDIGFMKLGVDRRVGDREKVLRVLFSVAGGQLKLPKNHSHIDEEHLVRRLEADQTGTITLRQCALGKLEPQDFNISWRLMGTLNGSGGKDSSTKLRSLMSIFWVSIASYVESDVRQLVLW